MRARQNRTHFSGSSNRQQQTQIQPTDFNKTSERLERSFAKSQSLHYKTSEVTHLSKPATMKDFSFNPNIGQHHQLDTTRFNVNSIKPYKYKKAKLVPNNQLLTFKDQVNLMYGDIKAKFEGKNINMHKLNQLKVAFLTNCADKRNLKAQFNQYSNNDGIIDKKGIKSIVKSYGFQINDDQADIMVQLTERGAVGLNINSFIELMTKENVHFATIQFDRKKFEEKQHFNAKIHEVIRNKFFQLREAFRIYTSRGEVVDQTKFDYVMKKLDINSLVLSDDEKKAIYRRFSDENGLFNPEAFIGNIAQQQESRIGTTRQQSDFADQIKVNQERIFQKNQQLRQYSLKDLSNLQYEKQWAKAQIIIKQIRKINKKKNVISEIMTDEQVTKKQVMNRIENILRSEGFNFKKHEYQAFISYLDFNKEGKMNQQMANKFIIEETQEEGMERIERKIRMGPPVLNGTKFQDYNENSAKTSLQKINDSKMNPQIKQLFYKLDRDRDGYISKKQFVSTISELNVLQKWELNNLANYIDQDQKGYLTYQKFADLFSSVKKQDLPLITQSKLKSQSCSEWAANRKTCIKSQNKYVYDAPSKYSAWPQKLRQKDLSLIQGPQKSGVYINEHERFNKDSKHDFGSQDKSTRQRLYENKLRKLSDWHNKEANSLKQKLKKEEDKQISRNYFLRLGKQIYEDHCHQGPVL